jgi:glycosyltransferase involved in cell wall biosynthesis
MNSYIYNTTNYENNVLYISYNGLLEPLSSSQVIPYLNMLSRDGFRFILLTFEKPKDLKKVSRQDLENIRNDLFEKGIIWKWFVYHKYPDKFSTFFDLLVGLLASIYLIFKNNIKIIHVRGVTPGAIGLLLLKIFKNTKVIFDTRGLLAEEYVGGGQWREGGFFYNLVKLIEAGLMKHADAIIVLTEKHYKINLELPYIRKNIPMAVIPCCVDLDKFKCDAIDRKIFLSKYRIDISSDILFIYPGKLGSYYLIKEMLDLFEYVCHTIPNARLFILTPDSPNQIKEMGKINALNGKIYFFHPSFEEMPLFLQCADVGLFFINPYKKFGSSPIKLGEFLASGKPVIINSGIGDTEELVINNRVGVVVRNFNNEEYLKKIGELLQLLKEGVHLTKRCRDTAEKYLSLNGGVERYKNIYYKLCR